MDQIAILDARVMVVEILPTVGFYIASIISASIESDGDRDCALLVIDEIFVFS